MKIAAIIVGALLGFVFVASGVVVLFNLVPMPPPPPPDSPMGGFFAAFGPTGYLTFVKVLEVIGGILVAIPRTRRAGLLVLGPIIINILAFHAFVAGEGVFAPTIVVICLLTLFLVWVERAAFAAFLGFRPATQSSTKTKVSAKVSETETVAS
jgi:putative oxidoreductase